jgi:hypothetical protein
MTILVPGLAVAFAALCIWLTVRIVNRRMNRGWAFWATVAVGTLLVAYPLGCGPMIY